MKNPVNQLSWKHLLFSFVLFFLSVLFLSYVTSAQAEIVTANYGANSIIFHNEDDNGNIAPVRTIAGANTLLNGPTCSFIYKGELFVTNHNNNKVLVFSSSASGNVAPIRTIEGADTMIYLYPTHCFAYNDELFLTTAGGNGNVLVFNTTDSGNVAPKRQITYPGIAGSRGMTLSGGELFVAYPGSGSKIYVFNSTDNGNVTPKRTIEGAATQITNAMGMSVYKGELFVANSDTILVFDVTASGNTPPKRVISGANTLLINTVAGVWVSEDEIFAVDSKISVFNVNDNGNVAPKRVINGGSTGLSSPYFVFVPPCVSPPSGMVSWWGGDNNALDMVGTNNGTLQGAATYATGKVGQAFSFDGTEASFVQISNSTDLNPNEAFSIDGWFYIDPVANAGHAASLVAKTSGGVGDGGWFLWFHDRDGYTKALRFDILTWGSPAWPFAEVNNFIMSAGWYHIAGVFDLASTPQAKLYVNGVLIASSSSTITSIRNNTYPIRIGASHWTDVYHVANDRLNGKADEVEFFNRALSAAEIAAIYNAGSAGKCRSCTPRPSSMVSWWPGDGNADDIIGTNNGTLQNGATFADGKVGRAFSLDGTNDYVEIPHSDSLNFGATQPMSMNLWIKRTNAFPLQTIMGKRPDCFTQLHYLMAWGAPGSGNYFLFGSTGAPANGVSTTADKLPLNTWTFVSITFDGATATMYINGTPVASHAMSFDPNTAPLIIGSGRADGCGYYFGGLIDELEIFNRALTADEIAAIYNAGSAGKCLPDTTPDPFPFTAQTGVALSTLVESNTIEITGIDSPAPISIAGGEYSIGCTGTFTDAEGTVVSGDTVCVQQTSSGSYFTKTTATLTIGGVSEDFEVTTLLSHTVQVVPSGTVSAGTSVGITSAPGDVACDWNGSAATGTCTSSAIGEGSQVVLTAVLPAGTTIGWGTGCDTATATTCTINSLTSDMTISPVTTAQTFMITATGAGVNGGTIIGGPIDATWNGSIGGTNTGLVIFGGGPINIVATGNTGIYATWSGDCDSTIANGTGAATCTINAGITADKNILAAFGEYTVRRFTTVATGHYNTIQDAYNNASDGEEIQAQEAIFTGDLNMNKLPDISVTLRGGFNSGFSANGGFTTVGGTMTISSGMVAVERIIVQ